jgi:predicted  nucleic acid-binding Zn-ribbon protein
MARYKGRRPADASKPAPATRPTSSGATTAGKAAANGTAGAVDAQPAQRPGGPPDPSPPPVSPASASPAGVAQPSMAPTGAAAAAPPGKPGAPASGTQGSSARPPSGGAGAPPGGSGAGGAAQGRPPGVRTPLPGNGSHRSFRNGVIGGLIGALIGGIATALALSYLWRSDPGGELPALRAQVDQLQGTIEGLQGGNATLSQLAGRIDALEQAAPPGIDEELQARLSELEQSAPDVADLASRIDALEASVTAGAEPTAADERIETLQEELAALSANVAAQALGEGDATAGDLALIETLQSRLAAIEADLSSPDAAAELALRLDALAARVDALEPLAEQTAGVQDALTGLSSRVEGLDAQVGGVGERIDALPAEIEGLSTRLAATENTIAAARDRSEQAAALALLTSQIDHAIAQSQGYEEPLRSLAALGDQDEAVRQEVAELTASAASGVPSLAQLRESFDPVAREVVQRARAPEGDSLIDQAAGNLLRLVTVRPVGADAEGEDPAAKVARAEAHLDAGDLAAAIAELETLEGPAAEAAADWLAQAKGRLAANAALERLRARTTELLTPPD